MALINVVKGSNGRYNASMPIPDTFPDRSHKEAYKVTGEETSGDARWQSELRAYLQIQNKDLRGYVFCCQPVILIVRYDEGWILETVSRERGSGSIEVLSIETDVYKQKEIFENCLVAAVNKATDLYDGFDAVHPRHSYKMAMEKLRAGKP